MTPSHIGRSTINLNLAFYELKPSQQQQCAPKTGKNHKIWIVKPQMDEFLIFLDDILALAHKIQQQHQNIKQTVYKTILNQLFGTRFEVMDHTQLMLLDSLRFGFRFAFIY
eukprot:1007834_1